MRGHRAHHIGQIGAIGRATAVGARCGAGGNIGAGGGHGCAQMRNRFVAVGGVGLAHFLIGFCQKPLHIGIGAGLRQPRLRVWCCGGQICK